MTIEYVRDLHRNCKLLARKTIANQYEIDRLAANNLDDMRSATAIHAGLPYISSTPGDWFLLIDSEKIRFIVGFYSDASTKILTEKISQDSYYSNNYYSIQTMGLRQKECQIAVYDKYIYLENTKKYQSQTNECIISYNHESIIGIGCKIPFVSSKYTSPEIFLSSRKYLDECVDFREKISEQAPEFSSKPIYFYSDNYIEFYSGEEVDYYAAEYMRENNHLR